MRGPLSAETVPLDEACASLAPALWADYVAARIAASGLGEIRRAAPLALSPNEKCRLAVRDAARAALDNWLRGCADRADFELWARADGRLQDLKPIPPTAIRALEFDYEKGTASGDGLPPLYDLAIRLPPAVPVKRWRKPPPTDVLKAAAIAVAEMYQPDNPPTAVTWKEALEAHLGETVTRKVARRALKDWAPHLHRLPGQKRNRRS